jgi:hypothetical protein
MVVTVALFIEYEAVLTRREHLARAEITAADAEIALDVLAAVAEPVESHFLWRPRLRDANDDMVLEAAVNGHVDAIATFNTLGTISAGPTVSALATGPPLPRSEAIARFIDDGLFAYFGYPQAHEHQHSDSCLPVGARPRGHVHPQKYAEKAHFVIGHSACNFDP